MADEWIEQRIKTCKEASNIIARMQLLEEIYNNEEVVVSSRKGSTKDRRVFAISGPKDLIERLEDAM